jgi:hypothetical protein
MRAIQLGSARRSPVDAFPFLACEAGHTVVGVVASGLDSETATDQRLAGVVGVATVLVVFACAAAGNEAPEEVLAARRQTNFAGRAWVLGVAEKLGVWTRGTEGARVAPWAAAVGQAAVGRRAAVDRAVEVDTTIEIDRCIASRIGGKRRRIGSAAAHRACGDQANVSKESHDREADDGGRLTVYGSVSAAYPHPGDVAA